MTGYSETYYHEVTLSFIIIILCLPYFVTRCIEEGCEGGGGGMFGKRDNRVQGSARVVEVHVFLKTYLVFLLLDGFLSSKRQVCLNLRVLQHSSFQTRANRDNQTSVQRHCGMRRSFSKVTSRGSGGDGGQNTTSS